MAITSMTVNVYRSQWHEYVPIPDDTIVRLGLNLDRADSLPGRMLNVTWYRATPYNTTELEDHGIVLRWTGERIL